MKIMAVACPAVAMLMLSACASGPSPDEVRQHLGAWRGQTDTALTSTYGYPQKTVDLQSGKKVYHYDFTKGCAADFEIDSKQIISDVRLSGSDLSTCPRKLPGGGTF
jgi:hypothetical protein